MPPASARPSLRIASVLFAVLAGGVQGMFTYALVDQTFHPEELVRAPVQVKDAAPVIARVNYGQDAGLAPEQRLLAVNGQPYSGQQTLLAALGTGKPGDAIALTVASAGGPARTIHLPLQQPPPQTKGWAQIALNLEFLLLSLFSVVLGVVVVLLKPWDRVAWILAFLLVSFTYMFSSGSFDSLPLLPRVAANSFHSFARSSWALWLLLFGIYFPERFHLDARVPWVKWLLAAPLAASAAIAAVKNVAAQESFVWTARLAVLDRASGAWNFVVISLAVSGFFLVVGVRRGTATNPDVRRRLRLLIAGASASFAPLFFFALAAAVMTRGFQPGTSFSPPWWTQAIVMPAIAVFPLTLGYLVLVHRALDLRVVIRQGLRYALARRGVLVLQAIAGGAAILVAAKASASDRVYAIALAILFVVGVRRAADRVRTWVDRRFFRDAYQAEHVLGDLSDSVRTLVETQPLLETVSRRIAETLHVPRITVLLDDSGGGFAPAYALGYDAPLPAVEFASDAVVVRELRRATEPLRVYFDDPSSWLNRAAGPGEDERGKLRTLGTQLLLPIGIKNRVLGILSLGPKRSEEPYSGTDLRLLGSVAAQTGLALENSRLAATIAQEAASRERLNRELEIARDVQRRFFPQRQPVVPGLDYAGLCRPAQSVGGDFYDFRELAGKRLGIAVGDVAGKGAPAALLMASVQASLRAQAISGIVSLATLVDNLNSLICEITPPSRFSTLFYGQYHPEERRLAWVNAGHNPPLLVRGGEAVRLALGGPAIGLSRNSKYQERCLELQPGDLLAAYTDGITEAMNGQREEFGEARFAEVLARYAGASSAQVLEAVLAAVDAFAAGAPQHDDITLVVLRVAEAGAGRE